MSDDIRKLEEQYWQAMKDRDLAAALAMTEDPCVVASPHGVATIDHGRYEEIFRAQQWTLDAFEISDVQVQTLTDDVAIVAYKVHLERSQDGKQSAVDAADVSTWVKRDGKWRCALHGEALTDSPKKD